MPPTPAHRLISESELQETVLRIFTAHHYLTCHISDSRRQIRPASGARLIGDALVKGYPDLTLVRDRTVIWAELKTERTRPTAEQTDWLNALPPHQAYLWRPSDLDIILQIAETGHPTDGRTCWECERRAEHERRKRGRNRRA